MRAVVSGTAAAYAVEAAHSWQLYKRGLDAPMAIRAADVGRVLGTHSGVIEIEVKTRQEANQALEREWLKSRALRVLILLLDSTEEETHSSEYVEWLDSALVCTYVAEYILNQFYARELPTEARISFARKVAVSSPNITLLLDDIESGQAQIKRVRKALDAVPDSAFDDKSHRDGFREDAINSGAFRLLAKSAVTGGLDGKTSFSLYKILQRSSSSRAVIPLWTATFEKYVIARSEWAEEDEREHYFDEEGRGGGEGGRQALNNAIEQQTAILDRVAAGDFDGARRFASDLMRTQLAGGGPEYLAKSLTRISQGAREMDAPELDLEWAFEAAKLAPYDGWAHCQYADALLQVGRAEEALREYDAAAHNGEIGYAYTGRARVLRMGGNFEDALEVQQEAKAYLKDSDQEIHAWRGTAQIYKDLGRLQDALAEYLSAIDKFPYDASLHVGLALTFLERGEYEKSWEAYAYASTLSKDKVEPLMGFARIRMITGNLKEARARYAEITEEYPREIRAHIGLIDTIRLMGDYQDASVVARRTLDRFPGSSIAQVRYGDVASEAGRHVEAKKILEDARARYPNDARTYLGVARAAQRAGRYEQALQAYEAALSRFPHNERARNGRAHMLRRLGFVAEARQDYLSNDKQSREISNGLASMAIVDGQHAEVLDGIAIENPQTQEEWRSFLLHALFLGKTGKRDDARARLEWANKNCNFSREARLSRAALAEYFLAAGKARRAPDVGYTPERDIGNIIDFRAAVAARRDSAPKIYFELQHNLPKPLEELRDEIARSGGMVFGQKRRSQSWINRTTQNLLAISIAA